MVILHNHGYLTKYRSDNVSSHLRAPVLATNVVGAWLTGKITKLRPQTTCGKNNFPKSITAGK